MPSLLNAIPKHFSCIGFDSHNESGSHAHPTPDQLSVPQPTMDHASGHKMLPEPPRYSKLAYEAEHKPNDNAAPATCPTGFEINTTPICPAGINIYAQSETEFDRIRRAHRTLAPTGCTRDFCQSGRATKTFEPRVGRDRPVEEIRKEATNFLRECRDLGIIETDEHLWRRMREALKQITETAYETLVTDENAKQFRGLAGGVWDLSPAELEYGLRASWRNARRCIMRSEFENLILCDLRHITTSRGMAHVLLEELKKSFNQGRILPTAFVFPPRQPGKRGPMLWNEQILGFAGYRQSDGSILGDPKSVELTDSMIELGWKTPCRRSRWDLLPLVTMAEGDAPYMTDLPNELRRLVQISHPRFKKEFQQLDLKWVMFPALGRLGFDIGGVQFTASPFVGWFMDAEIGVRNLADAFRYNTLPAVAKELRLSDDPDTPFEELPEYMHMVAMSRAQAELNYAVYYSYLNEHITMVDTMTASTQYVQFDEDRQLDVGYRLPSDPYWLAPPQGSIVPVWHRGAAPNYQPKPMIARHVQDPVKAWRREIPAHLKKLTTSLTLLTVSTKERGEQPKMQIFTCSAGVTAGKLAQKLYQILERSLHEASNPFTIEREKPLNMLSLAKICPEDVILIIASTTGRGAIPRNAAQFMKAHANANPLKNAPRYSIYANGDSTYGDSFNAAPNEIVKIMTRIGMRTLLDHVWVGDTAKHNPDWNSFNHWAETLDHLLLGNPHKIELPISLTEKKSATALAEMPIATLTNLVQPTSNGMCRITLNIGQLGYREMDHVKILPPNTEVDVERALMALRLSRTDIFGWHSQEAFNFLSQSVDLNQPFKTLAWFDQFEDIKIEERQALLSKSTLEILEGLTTKPDIPLLEKIYGNLLDILVKVNAGGRFSDAFLSQAQKGSKFRFSLTQPDTWELIQTQKPNAPFIAIATGSGLGPVRSLLQRRLADIDHTACARLPVPRAQATMSPVNGEFSWFRPDSRQCRASMAGRWHEPMSPTMMSPIAMSPANEQWRNSTISTTGREHDVRSPTSRMSMYGQRAAIARQQSLNYHHARLGIKSAVGSVSLFAGFKASDQSIVDEIVEPAKEARLFDILELVPSNVNRIRVQDQLLEPANKTKLRRWLRDPACIVFICANDTAAKAAVDNLSLVAGEDIREFLAERLIEEVFRG